MNDQCPAILVYRTGSNELRLRCEREDGHPGRRHEAGSVTWIGEPCVRLAG